MMFRGARQHRGAPSFDAAPPLKPSRPAASQQARAPDGARQRVAPAAAPAKTPFATAVALRPEARRQKATCPMPSSREKRQCRSVRMTSPRMNGGVPFMQRKSSPRNAAIQALTNGAAGAV